MAETWFVSDVPIDKSMTYDCYLDLGHGGESRD